jgi:chromosome segregation ATPase
LLAEQLKEKEREIEELNKLAEEDKLEMERQYAEFAEQYAELKKSVQNDSIIALLDKEQKRAEKLLKELKNVKATSSAEILRLKNELATVRAVLKDYIRQVDSLQRINISLASERDQALAEAERTRKEKVLIDEQREQLKEKVEIASQLNATNVVVSPLKKNGKAAKKSKDIKTFSIDFIVTRNVTAQTGNRMAYVRLMKPNNQIVNAMGQFTYENRSIEYSAAKAIEYDGSELHLQLYVPVQEYLTAGTYQAYIFIDGNMIGQGSVTLKK